MLNRKLNKVAFIAVLLLSACAPKAVPVSVVVPTEEVKLQPGVAAYVWEEPVVDVVDVPPGLDPDGVYYRPAHKEVVEVRQGRWQYYKGAEEANK